VFLDNHWNRKREGGRKEEVAGRTRAEREKSVCVKERKKKTT